MTKKNSKKTEAVAQKCFVKKVFLKISRNSQENTCARVSFLNEAAGPATLFKKETLAQVFSFSFFYRAPPVAASE